MELTLFGVTETKTETKKRAERIALLLGRLADSPADRRAIHSNYNFAVYLIKKARTRKMDPNDHDGLQRNVGDISDLLTDKEAAAFSSTPKNWKPLPKGWPGWALPNARYAVTLHPKEIAYLEEVRDDAVAEMLALREALRDYRRELAKLRGLGTIPPEVANRYQITPQGFPLEAQRRERSRDGQQD